MKIVLRPHLKIRLKERSIPANYPKKIITSSNSQYFDTLTKHFIAIKKLKYGEGLKPMVAAYDIIDHQIQVITCYPTKLKDIKSKLKNKRWTKYEKD